MMPLCLELVDCFLLPNGSPYVIFGDPAYGMTHNILSPFRGSQTSQREQAFNRSMSQVHICVEWAFWKLTQYFSFVDFRCNNRLLLQPVAKYYLIAALLTSCHTCLYGSLTSTFFNWIHLHWKHTCQTCHNNN